MSALDQILDRTKEFAEPSVEEIPGLGTLVEWIVSAEFRFLVMALPDGRLACAGLFPEAVPPCTIKFSAAALDYIYTHVAWLHHLNV